VIVIVHGKGKDFDAACQTLPLGFPLDDLRRGTSLLALRSNATNRDSNAFQYRELIYLYYTFALAAVTKKLAYSSHSHTSKRVCLTESASKRSKGFAHAIAEDRSWGSDQANRLSIKVMLNRRAW
jgi:hypothetical protein